MPGLAPIHSCEGLCERSVTLGRLPTREGGEVDMPVESSTVSQRRVNANQSAKTGLKWRFMGGVYWET